MKNLEFQEAHGQRSRTVLDGPSKCSPGWRKEPPEDLHTSLRTIWWNANEKAYSHASGADGRLWLTGEGALPAKSQAEVGSREYGECKGVGFVSATLPTQADMFGDNWWPGGQSHLKLPSVLMQTPPRHSKGFLSHSSMSVEVKQKAGGGGHGRSGGGRHIRP